MHRTIITCVTDNLDEWFFDIDDLKHILVLKFQFLHAIFCNFEVQSDAPLKWPRILHLPEKKI